MKQFTLLLFASLFPAILYAQLLITGQVLDAQSKAPVSDASVFCENTTTGTITDKQGNFSLSLNPGGYNLIISIIGYKTQSLLITESKKIEILLVKDVRLMEEVTVTTKSNAVEDGWLIYGTLFTETLIGTTPNASDCKILNPEVLRFYYTESEHKLKAIAKSPLKIQNKSLGYIITYLLDSFTYYSYNALYSYIGKCLYTEMEGSNNKKKIWIENRKKAYEGSVLHFMRSYYRGTLQKEGWEIRMQRQNDATRFDKLKKPFDSLYYKREKAANYIEILYPRRILITYLKKNPEAEYLQKYELPNSTAGLSSVVDMRSRITLNENGYYYNPLNWVSYNYWSWKNLADMLPFDYTPPD
jgi:CarboxypepD_reg-like domain